ncbi:MAG: hypothetical protein AMXMBFR84_12680 [Candidatus Hydrogenedentota bacterium]
MRWTFHLPHGAAALLLAVVLSGCPMTTERSLANAGDESEDVVVTPAPEDGETPEHLNNGGGTPPPNNGGGTPPPNNGGGTPPPNNGGGTPPPNNGGGTPPPNNGGGTPPPNNGAGTPPPNNGGGTPPPNNGGGTPPMGVDPRSQLMITDLRVVEDPVRTNPASGDQGVWTFKYLIEQMAGTRNPSAFALEWLRLWEQDQVVNGRTSSARPSIRPRVIDPWMQVSGGSQLDLSLAPFKLLAIVNRIDLREHDGTTVVTGGEGRFVFGVLAPDGTPLLPAAGSGRSGFLVIFEYELPATTMDGLRDWALAWRGLGSSPLGSPEYNAALEQITRRFSDRGSALGKPNGNALNQIRTNEIALRAPWEMREFVIDGTSGFLRQTTVALTPDTIELNGTQAFADLINDGEADILAGTGQLSPDAFAASSLVGPFREGDFPDFADRTYTILPLANGLFDVAWSAAGIVNNDARHEFALNTCSGCHRAETRTGFVMVGFPADHTLPESLGRPAALSGFLRGVAVPDPVEPETVRHFADLQRRKLEFEALLASFGEQGSGPGPRGEHRPRFVH